MSAVRKRSVSIRGHQTSYSVEDAFHAVLTGMARERNTSLAALIASIDQSRQRDENLSSALRLAALDWVRSRNS
jgi:predicted DNA-binding ribbon-helix-helix protein